MASTPKPVPVTLGDGTAWEVDLPPEVIGLHILHLLNHDFTAAEMGVFRPLGIDRASRRGTGRVVRGRLHDYRWRNKALAMELLVALLLTRIDSPVRVNSECVTDPATGLPHMFAPPGSADVTASYTVTSPMGTFRVVVEASAMRFMPIEGFRDQLSQAVRHSREQQENTGQFTYALVINSAPVLTYKRFHEMYRAMLHSEGVADDPSICLIAINAADLALALCDLAVKLPADRFPFGTEQLRDVFDALYVGLRQSEPNGRPDWMRHIWTDIIVDGATPELALEQERDNDEMGAQSQS